MKLLRNCFVGCAALVLLTACAEYPQTMALLAKSDGLPRQAEVANVRFVSHVDEQGAPAALAMALTWSGAPSEPTTLAPRLKGEGLQKEIVGEARQRGRNAYPVTELRGVLQEIAAGHPVLVRQEPSGRPTPVWRYALAIGYDLDAKVLLVHSGRLEHVKLPFQVFESNWQRAGNWGVVVMAPNQPPASSTALAAYSPTPTTTVAQATPAPAAKGASAATSQVAAAVPPKGAAGKVQLADTATTKQAAKAQKPTTKVADKSDKSTKPTTKVAAKPSSQTGKQVATVPAEKPAKTEAAPVTTTKGRQAAVDPGLARLLSVVPVAYHR